MTTFLRWFNREHPAGKGCRGHCWRHAILWWLGERGILVTGDGDYWHNGHFVLNPRHWHKAWP